MLVVTGALGLASAGFGIIFGIIQAGTGANKIDPALLAELPPEQAELLLRIFQSTQGGSLVLNVLVLTTSALVIFGALKMRKLESRGLAVAASIVAMLPCLGPCCCIGLPSGIWSLVVLMKEDVKAAFSS
jgi:hypothetical protein